MYRQHFGLTKKPFSLSPDPQFLYLSKKHKKTLTILQYGIMSQAGVTVITGEIGSGKTTVIRHVLNVLSDECAIGLITNTHAAFGDLLSWVLQAFQIKERADNQADRYQLLLNFFQSLHDEQRRAILIVDDAQNMDTQTLKELCLLSNINIDSEVMVQLVLVGQPELVDKLKTPELIHFAQRISIEFHLTPLDYKETESYIYHRIIKAGGRADIFPRVVCAVIYYFTGGVPRLINNICDLCLAFSYAEDDEIVSLEVVIDVIKEKQVGGIVPLAAQVNGDGKKIKALIMNKYEIDLDNI
ncbi:MAG: AAA family ATPase [Methyloprofundus sp.]|nr:AAA family ATPase [Methyloprofundus sp.]